LPISKALALLSVPESEREDFAAEVGAETISVRELEARVRERTAEIEAEKRRWEEQAGCYASRVNDLRREGHPIVTEVVEGRNRYGEKTRWARYRMGART
jgi:Rad3-related DNA helicase